MQKQAYAFILGSHPELSLAEIQAVVQPVHLSTNNKSIAFVSGTQLDPKLLMSRLGGVIKIAHLTQQYDQLDKIDLPKLSALVPDSGGRAIFGVSIYQVDGNVSLKQLRNTARDYGLHLKSWFKEHDRGARFVTNQDGEPLSAVTIDKEKLLSKGREIVLVVGRDGVWAGVTEAVQPYEDFSHRDYDRPGRSMKTGMLPPKVARMLINMSQPRPDSRILDPFMGTGTILHEAMLMGFKNVEGNDIDPHALEMTRRNLAWLKLPQVKLHNYKAQRLPHHIKSGVYDRIVFEGLLGPTDQRAIGRKIGEIKDELAILYSEVVPALGALLPDDGILVGAFPAWRLDPHQPELVETLPIPDFAKSSGLAITVGPLLYGRPDATVLRQIWVMKKATQTNDSQ